MKINNKKKWWAIGLCLMMSGCAGTARRAPATAKGMTALAAASPFKESFCHQLRRQTTRDGVKSRRTFVLLDVAARSCGAEINDVLPRALKPRPRVAPRPPPRPRQGPVPQAAPLAKGDGPCFSRVPRMAAAYKIQAWLLAALVWVESRGDPNIISRADCSGCMQLGAGVVKDYKVTDVFDPEQNMKGGAAYLRYLYDRYGGDWVRAVAAYNKGVRYISRRGPLHLAVPNKSYTCKVFRQGNTPLAREAVRQLRCPPAR